LELLLREGRLLAAARSPAVIRVDLDPVGAPSSLLAHRADHFRDTARLLGALRRAAHIRPQAPGGRAVGAGGDDGASHDEETRTLDEAVLDRALQRHVGEVGALGAEIAQRRETGDRKSTRLNSSHRTISY